MVWRNVGVNRHGGGSDVDGTAEAAAGVVVRGDGGVGSVAGHPFYRKLNELLAEAGFDRWIEGRCGQYYEAPTRRPAIASAGRVLSDAVGRLLRGNSTAARHRLAVRRQPELA